MINNLSFVPESMNDILHGDIKPKTFLVGRNERLRFFTLVS